MTTSIFSPAPSKASAADRSASLLDAVRRRCALSPSALAAADGAESLTYAELDRKAAALASRLRALGAGRDVPVAIFLDRSPAFVVAALAALRAGAAYLPLDSASTPARASAILEDAAAPLLISTPQKAALLGSGPWRLVDVNAPHAETANGPDPHPNDLAYIIYTSGSTGRPKGVEVTHANLTNLVHWHNDAFAVTPEDRAGQVAGLGFDAAVWEIWPYLAAGASIHFAPEDARRSPQELRDWLLDRRITIGFVPTALAEFVIEMSWPPSTPLRTMLTGADTLYRRPPESLPFTLINNYGPTECTVVTTSGPVSSTGSRPTIGRPIANCTVHILDENLRELPPGEPGELTIGGAGVARGYRNLPDATREKFIPDPFSPGLRLYRSGDRARLLPNGEIEFLGRLDDQIKIRGFRVEPGEITAALNQHPAVRAAAVIPHNGELAAYVVPAPGAALTTPALREFLVPLLPDYMIPAVFVRLDAIPVNASGKCDRAALPAPAADNLLPSPAAKNEASTATEKTIAEIVVSQLGIAAVSRDDNFFLLGGHSMFAARLNVRLREVFGVSLSLRQLFQAPTVASLAAQIDRLPKA